LTNYTDWPPRCQQGAILTGDYKFRPGTYSDSKPAGYKGEEETKSGLAGGGGFGKNRKVAQNLHRQVLCQNQKKRANSRVMDER